MTNAYTMWTNYIDINTHTKNKCQHEMNKLFSPFSSFEKRLTVSLFLPCNVLGRHDIFLLFYISVFFFFWTHRRFVAFVLWNGHVLCVCLFVHYERQSTDAMAKLHQTPVSRILVTFFASTFRHLIRIGCVLWYQIAVLNDNFIQIN